MRFIQANKTQKQDILDYLYKKSPYLNTFLISDIESFGLFEQDKIATYVNEGTKIEKVILFFYSNLVIYFNDANFDHTSFNKIIQKHNAKNIILVGVEPEFIFASTNKINLKYNVLKEQFDALNLQKFQLAIKEAQPKSQKITLQDIDSIICSRKLIKEFQGIGPQYLDPHYLTSSLNKGSYFGYIIKNGDLVVSHAASSSITDKAVMLGGIFTLKSYRGQQLAQDCVINLCNDIIKQKKLPILFWNNPSAGKLYQRLGFEKIGELTVLVKIN